MFDALSDRFDAIFTRLRGRGRLGEPEVDEVLREIRLALLEADVNFKVVKGLVARIKEQCVGADLSKSLTPAQQVIKIVHDELVQTLGGESLKITYASRPPTVVLMAGLQGSGKTTAAAKLARWFKQQGRNPLLAGDDRGGAALSVKEVIGRPIAFASVGEKLADFETFHPDRMAGRILGMGDVMTLIEKAEEAYDADAAEQAAAKLAEGRLTLEDFL